MKRIHFEPEVPVQFRDIQRHIGMTILEAIHRYAETGACLIKLLCEFPASMHDIPRAQS